jgi:hypothetical protein
MYPGLYCHPVDTIKEKKVNVYMLMQYKQCFIRLYTLCICFILLSNYYRYSAFSLGLITRRTNFRFVSGSQVS